MIAPGDEGLLMFAIFEWIVLIVFVIFATDRRGR